MKRKFTIVHGTECDSIMMPHGEETKCVGEIYGNTLVTKRDPLKHIMRRWNSYGINKDIIESDLFDTVVIQEPTQSRMITVEDLKTFSRLEHLEGEDPQYFVPIDKLQTI
jgi:hypothetical protein